MFAIHNYILTKIALTFPERFIYYFCIVPECSVVCMIYNQHQNEDGGCLEACIRVAPNWSSTYYDSHYYIVMIVNKKNNTIFPKMGILPKNQLKTLHACSWNLL